MKRTRCQVAYNVAKPSRSLTLHLHRSSDVYKITLSANIE
jgi:hypothetical protein